VEKATASILLELGVSTVAVVQTKPEVAKAVPLCAAYEHTVVYPVTYQVVDGNILIDIRDHADCWIRATVVEGESFTIPPGLQCRVAGEGTSIIQCTAPVEYQYRFPNKSDNVALNSYHSYRELVCDLCRQFFTAGWVTGTGGSISIRHGNRIYMTPSGVQKERILPDELYVLDLEGEVLAVPEQKPGGRLPKLSDCAPLFLHAFKQRQAGAVLHSHAMCCNLVTSLFEGGCS
jgi:methylthioribulose 1-phosphate dehydratase/enolase-phosphatase E1